MAYSYCCFQRFNIQEKGIDILISTSYGLGRYDRNFEEHNVKYPLDYVRWTETENFKVYLSLIANGNIQLMSNASYARD